MTISKADRPLSPHLQIYKLPLTAKTSIFHRFTGVVLSLGLLVLVAWLYAAAYNADLYACMSECLSSTVGLIALAGWTFAFFYHLANGVRHMVWDIGRGLDKHVSTRSGVVVILVALLATAGTWYSILCDMGVI